jgi:hypothetical protein
VRRASGLGGDVDTSDGPDGEFDDLDLDEPISLD